MSYVVSKKEHQPSIVGYIPPKGKVQLAKTSNEQKGFPDASENVWIPIPEGHPLFILEMVKWIL